MRFLLVSAVILGFGVRGATAGAPRFEEYPAGPAYTGPIAAPRIVSAAERRYRTVIRKGVRFGHGVVREPEGVDRRGPNFAGHYLIVQWGCGTDCIQYAIVNAKTGTIHQPPGAEAGSFDGGQLDYRLGSRLVEVKTNCEYGGSDRCDRTYFLWEDERFREIRKIPRAE